MSLYLNGNPLIILIYAFIKSMDSLNLRLKSSQGVPGTSSPSASALGRVRPMPMATKLQGLDRSCSNNLKAYFTSEKIVEFPFKLFGY